MGTQSHKPNGGEVGGELDLVKTPDGNIVVRCRNCAYGNIFRQPYPYHAGFGNQGFLYNDAGNRTLVWSTFDPAYCSAVGSVHPWVLDSSQRQALESKLLESTTGGRWAFGNPARCLQCHEPISGPITDTIYYLQYDDSVDADEGLNLGQFIRSSA